MEGIIYIIKNGLNNKVYIGKTYTSLSIRWNKHLSTGRDNSTNVNNKLYRAIRELGEGAFYTEFIGRYRAGELEKMEVHFINKYDSYYNGYNSTKGGDGQRSSRGIEYREICPICGKHKVKRSKMCEECNRKKSQNHIPTKEQLEVQLKYMNCTELAAYYCVAIGTVSKWLNKFNTGSKHNTQNVLCVEHGIVFSTKSDASRYLLAIGLSHDTGINSVAYSIGLACKTGKAFRKIHWEYTEQEVNFQYLA